MPLYEKINRKYQATNRIYSALFEVTYRCPCACVHCFLARQPQQELTLPEIATLFEQLHAEGTIELTFSGGEPLLREDFFEILALASRHHFLFDILTTGLLLGKAEVALLKKYGVNKLELSLLGAGPATHDSLMRYPGAFAKLKRAVSLLKEADMLLALKSTVIKPNWQELQAMARLAADWGVRFSASLSLVPREGESGDPADLFLSPPELEQVNMALIEGALLSLDREPAAEQLLCRAGSTTAAISPSGDVFPCVLLREKIGNIRTQSLLEIWHEAPAPLLQHVRALKAADLEECIVCTYRSYCPRCTGIAYQETGRLSASSPSACLLAKHRVPATVPEP